MVRIYCLSSICHIPPLPDYPPPAAYDKEADEVVLNLDGYHDISNRDTFSPNYLLTEICIGWKPLNEETKKVYELQRGLVTIENVDQKNGSFELHLAISKFPPFNGRPTPTFDLKIKVIFIKNTTVKRIITKAEELAYNDYAEKISTFCTNNKAKYPNLALEDLQMEAIKQLGSLILPNQSQSKFLRQKLRDFQQAIYLLCNPKTGSYSNIPVNEYDPETKKAKVCRFYQQIECLLFLKQSTWFVKEARAIKKEEKFCDCIYLDWANITLRDKDSDVFAFQNLRAIDFDNVDLGESLKYWHSFAARISIKELYSISFHNCRIKHLNGEFFEFLPREISCLSFIDNDIQHISKKISKLQHLSILDLSNNKNLSENGIPWTMLPSNLGVFNLDDTNITNIPEEIWWLKSLTDFKVRSSRLKHISWADFSRNIGKISITGGGNEINVPELSHIDILAVDLSISNLKMEQLDVSNLPSCLKSLHLINTHLGIFNTSDINYRNNEFDELCLPGNELKEFSWEGCPKVIKRLILSNNRLNNISIKENTLSFATFTNLTEISLEGNTLNSLPEGFENLPQLSILNLSFNHFDYNEFNLMEVLWQRLPKTLTVLKLCNNKIATIPCFLKNFAIRNLHVSKCNLYHCCPFLHANVQEKEDYMVIDASDNPNLSLSFIPSRIYRLPRIVDVKPFTGKALYHQDGIPNYANFSTTTLKGDFSDTSKTTYTKAIYKFSSEEVEQNNRYACKCCGMCGETTEEPIFKQKMAMDSILLIQEEEGVEDTKSTTYHSSFKPPIYYKPGQWRTELKSRLCMSCKKVILEKIDKAFGEKTKKKKFNNENENINDAVLYDNQIEAQNPEAVYDDAYMESVPIPLGIDQQLPSIQTLYHSGESAIKDFIPPPTFDSLNPNTITLYESSVANDIVLHNTESTFSYNIPQQRTVLLDQYGREYARWEHVNSTSSNLSQNVQIQALAQEEMLPLPSNNSITNLTAGYYDNNVPQFSHPSDEVPYWCNL